MKKQVKKSSLKMNFILNTFLQLINIIAPFLTAPYVSRVLGVEQIGIYSYTYSINYYFIMIAGLGTATYGIVEIAKARDRLEERSRNFWTIEIITIVMSGVCVLAWVAFSVLYKEYSAVMFPMTFYLFAVAFDISWFYLGIEKVKYTVFVNVSFKLLGVALIFTFVNSADDLIMYVIILSVTTCAGNISMWIFLKQFVCKTELQKEDFICHIKGTVLYFIPTIATSVYTVLDKTLIGLITHDNAENGYYEQATKIITLIKTVAYTSLNTLLGSRMAYVVAQKDNEEINRKRDLAINFVLLLGIGACFGVMGISHDFMPLFFGEEYREASLFLMLMAPLIPIMGISNLIGNLYYNPTGQRKKSTVLLVIGCVVNIGLNLIFIPWLEGKGAIIATLLSEVLITSLYIYHSKKFITTQMLLRVSIKKILAGVIMLLYIWVIGKMLGSGILILLLQCIGGILSYFIILFVLKDEFVRTNVNKIVNKFYKN